MAIVVAIAGVQTIPPALTHQPPPRILLQLALWLLETPVQWAILSVAFDRATRRGVGSTRMILEGLLISAVVGACFVVALVFAADSWLGVDTGSGPPVTVPVLVGVGVMVGLFNCGIWAMAFVIPFTSEQSRLRALEADRLALEARQLRTAAEMASLRSRLEPHFLLNTLNTVAGLVTQEPREARRLLGCLGDLLRDSTREQDEMQPLTSEITWLRRYAEILTSRHGDVLLFEWEIEEATDALLVPRLLLQPLVENAVKHGALRRNGGGRVTVKAFLKEDPKGSEQKLVCVVTDNGPGMTDAEPRAGAFGLESVRQRLRLRAAGSRLELKSSDEGTQAIVELPVLRGRRPESQIAQEGQVP